MNMKRAILCAMGVMSLLLGSMGNPAHADSISSNTHNYAFGGDPNAIVIDVEIFDNFMGDFNKYLWQYTVHNNSYDPNPGVSNGFSGFETALPAGVPDLGDLSAPNASWVFDCCSGQPVEWDIRNSAGLGVMPGQTGVFGFTSLPREITQSTGWFHTWENDGQTFIVNYPTGDGVEVPDVTKPPINQNPIPEPSTILLFGSGLAALGWLRSRKK